MSLLYLQIALILIQASGGAKITILHMFGGSHFITTNVIAEELARRGHEVTMWSPGKTAMEVHTKEPLLHILPVEFDKGKIDKIVDASSPGLIGWLNHQHVLLKTVEDLCDALLSNDQVVDNIKSADLIILEMTVFCGGFVVEKFKKKFICIVPTDLPHFLSSVQGVTLSLSSVPFRMSGFSEEMTFWERFQNFAVMSITSASISFANTFGEFKKKHNIKDYDFIESFKSAELFIGNCDFAMGYSYPQMPNTLCVASWTSKPANRLPPDFDVLANGAENGIIFVSFGTTFHGMEENELQTMINAFGKLKQLVIWKLKDHKDLQLPSNVKPVSWAPQNDLLGHPKMMLFISHVGQSSLMEAGYHGVPVLATPRVIDQIANAKILVHKMKMGEMIDTKLATEDKWIASINKILNNESYRLNAERVSRLIKTRKQTPMQLAGDWIQYVIDNNYDMSHLKSRSQFLPWYIRDLWDLYAFIVLLLVLGGIITRCLVKAVVRCVCRGKHKKE